jgi:3-carboxy-cis,cis-muconate cycloisomerase
MTARAASEIFGESETLALYLSVEVALARAQAEVGLIPADAARVIEQRALLDAVDVARVRDAARSTGYAVAPLVRQLTQACGEAGRFVHWGATTQDIVNTALSLQLDEALKGVLSRTERLAGALARLVQAHRSSVMPARTFGSHALPITFGFKAAVWLAAVLRHVRRTRAAVEHGMPGEFAGAAGTLASLHEQGLAVRSVLMRRLRLREPTITWSGMRDEVFERMALVVGLTNTVAKIAQDIAELASTEIAEVAEPDAGGKDTSSTLPLKANPIRCAHIAAAAALVAQGSTSVLIAGRQHQERSGEGLLELQVIGPAFIATERCLDGAVSLLEGLQVFPARMRRNLDATRGIVLGERFMMALAPHVGRLHAHDLVHEACQVALEREVHLVTALAQMPAVTRILAPSELESLGDPRSYLGSTDAMCEAVLREARSTLEDAYA